MSLAITTISLCVLVAHNLDAAQRDRELGITLARERDVLVGDHGEAVAARGPVSPLFLDGQARVALGPGDEEGRGRVNGASALGIATLTGPQNYGRIACSWSAMTWVSS